MTNDRLQELMTRSLSGEATAGELQELESMLAADSKAMERYKLLQQFWNRHDAVSQQTVEDALQNMLGKLKLVPTIVAIQPPHRKLWRRLSAAAAVIMVLGAAAFWYLSGSSKQAAANPMANLVEKQNARGTKSTIELTDGSKIWLNADSRIHYPEVFTGSTREVYLNGEAFFEIAKNPSRPFIIHLANGTVRVLGTSFNIRAYDNEKIVETSVATGKVAFIPKPHGKKQQDTVFITPNNKVRYVLDDELLNIVPTTAAEDRAWTEGRLIFKALTLEEIAIELERNFGKKVTFMDDAPKSYRLTGSFQNNSLDEIMYYLSQSKEFYYKITNGELLITSEAINLQ